MKQIRIAPDHEEFPADITRIVQAFGREGLLISRHSAQDLWRRYSDTYCAGWLLLPDDDSIVPALELYFEVYEVGDTLDA